MLIVTGDGIERPLPVAHSMAASAISASLYLTDFSAELKADLASGAHDQDDVDGVHLVRQRSKGN